MNATTWPDRLAALEQEQGAMTLAPLVALYSPAAGSGKSTTAQALEARGWRVVKFAGPLKAMLAALLREAEEDEATIARMIEGDLKQMPSYTLFGRTPRHAMQTLGTEWGRAQMGADFWVRAAMFRVERLRSAGTPVVIDDCRFPNEADAVQETGGLVVEIRRDGVANDASHSSEGALAGFPFDLVLHNTDGCATSWAERAANAIDRLIEQGGVAAC